jgi:hypothetical protein
MPPTDEQAKAYAAGLVEELRFAEVNHAAAKDNPDLHPDAVKAAADRVKDVKAELHRVAGDAKSPAKRAERRPRKKRESRKKKTAAAKPAAKAEEPKATGLTTSSWHTSEKH